MEKNPDACDYSKAQVSWRRKQQNGKASEMLARSFLLSYSLIKDSLYRSLPFAFLEILQVPGPLTAEMEARQATRRREQKAARRHREEQQRKQQEQEKQEQEEQQRFAALSDREKVRLGVLPSTATLPQRSDLFPGVQPSLLRHVLHC